MLRTLSLLLLSLLLASAHAAEDMSITLPSGVEVASQHFPAPHGPVLLWFTGEYGAVEAERQAASSLAAKGVDVWLTDWLAPYFLPPLAGSMAKVPDKDLGDWLAAIQSRYPGRAVLLAASGHTADLALRAARDARDRLGKTPLGSVLMFPLLYRGLEAGAAPDYDPVVDATRLKLDVLVPKSSAGYWWRDRLAERLQAAGSQVWLTVLPGMRDGFYRRPDATEQEIAAGNQLGDTLWQALKTLLGEKQP
jgi:acetyl esterase/lipase